MKTEKIFDENTEVYSFRITRLTWTEHKRFWKLTNPIEKF
jgi:hypothetical protein